MAYVLVMANGNTDAFLIWRGTNEMQTADYALPRSVVLNADTIWHYGSATMYKQRDTSFTIEMAKEIADDLDEATVYIPQGADDIVGFSNANGACLPSAERLLAAYDFDEDQTEELKELMARGVTGSIKIIVEVVGNTITLS